ncbi:hypothetical protein [Actinomycetospora sp.]|uniref:hypothetical protein n=1 Tax=Actinomycetospora sp. TaxID=1872135 RepID=UPI002F3E42B4
MSTTIRALASMRSPMRRICLGVNAAEISLRIFVCRGGSILMMDCPASTASAGRFSIRMLGSERKSS